MLDGSTLRAERPRICVVGDELVAGIGDPRGLGWTGRVVARTETELELLTLAIPGENTSDLSRRWSDEVRARWVPGGDNRLLIALGRADADQRGSLARSRLNLANMIDAALHEGLKVFIVGPPPLGEPSQRLADLSEAWQEVAARRNVAYVECYRPLVAHEQWLEDMAAGDGVHPGQNGYGLMAWLVLHSGWEAWLAS